MPKLWTKQDCAIAARLWKKHRDLTKQAVCELIGRHIGRSALAVNQRMHYYGATFAGAIRSTVVRIRPAVTRSAAIGITTQLRIPDDVIALREAREAARARRDMVGILMGDPPVGFSALYQREPQLPRGQSPLSAQIARRDPYATI